jgi:surface polysaccharide O-acyltransferase-like enzyme
MSDRPIRYFVALVAASAVGYLPLALAFTPWEWWHHGPFAFQLSRPLHYAVYFFGGAAIGAYGLDRGLFAMDGILVRRWKGWLGTAVAAFVLWVAITALTMGDQAAVPLALQIAAGLAFVTACAASCFVIVALVLKFAARDIPSLHGLKECAYGIYLIHYVFIVWLQFAMLNAPLPAVIKAPIVFGGTLVLSWGIISAAIRSLPRVALVIGGDRRAVPKAS